jgi:hypothetical protein
MEKSVTQLAVFFGKPKGKNRKTEEQKKTERLGIDRQIDRKTKRHKGRKTDR